MTSRTTNAWFSINRKRARFDSPSEPREFPVDQGFGLRAEQFDVP